MRVCAAATGSMLNFGVSTLSWGGGFGKCAQACATLKIVVIFYRQTRMGITGTGLKIQF